MADFVDTSDLRLLISVDPNELPVGAWQEISRAEYDTAAAIPLRYRKWSGSAVVEMSQAEKDAADTAKKEAEYDAAIATLSNPDELTSALSKVFIDELNAARAKLVPPLSPVSLDYIAAAARAKLGK